MRCPFLHTWVISVLRIYLSKINLIVMRFINTFSLFRENSFTGTDRSSDQPWVSCYAIHGAADTRRIRLRRRTNLQPREYQIYDAIHGAISASSVLLLVPVILVVAPWLVSSLLTSRKNYFRGEFEGTAEENHRDLQSSFCNRFFNSITSVWRHDRLRLSTHC